MGKGLILFSRRHKGIIMYAMEGACGGGQMLSAPNRESPAASATASENSEPPIPQTTCGPTQLRQNLKGLALIHIFKIKFQDAAAYGFAPRRACPNARGFRTNLRRNPVSWTGRKRRGNTTSPRRLVQRILSIGKPFYLKRLRAAASTIDAAPRIAAATSGSGTCVIPT